MHSTDRCKLALLTAALLAPATGCAAEDEPGLDTTTGGDDEADLEFRTTPAITSWGCGEPCGDNDPEVNGTPIPDFDRAGAANDAGVIFQGLLSPSAVPHALGVEGDEPVALNSLHAVVARREGLIGWKMKFLVDGALETIKFTSFDNKDIASWHTGSPTLPVFGLAYLDQDDKVWKNICPEFESSPNQATVTVLAGERYDLADREVLPDLPTWITLACRNQAAYKMKRLGYAPHSVFADNQPATVAQRQATLKMITADYCGDGKPYTESGTHVYWRNADQSVDMYSASASMEALWTANGALCIDTPRFAPIEAVDCAIPQCTTQMIDAGGWEWITRKGG